LVCPECGSLRECAHDRDELRGSNLSDRFDHHDHEHDNCYEMVSNTGIAPNSEVFNTFGETLTNSQLLNQYGFVLDVNENDRLLWSAQEIFATYDEGETTDETVETAIVKAGDVLLGSLLNLSDFFDQSQLVCHEPDVEHKLYVNDEGMISAGLWTLLTAFTASSLQITDTVIEQLTEIVDAQLRMESFSEEAVNRVEESSPASVIVLQTARSVVKLCDRRKRKSGKPASFDCDLSDLLGVRVTHLLSLFTWSLLNGCKANTSIPSADPVSNLHSSD
jgi:SET domain-containing protein 6